VRNLRVGKVARLWGADMSRLSFWCKGCGEAHNVTVAGAGPVWGWNGSLDSPTMSPSLLVTYNGDDAGIDGAPPAVCHSFVREGRIEYLGDCTHTLAGRTTDLPEWPLELGGG
jgi:hypothetical protein